jgi:hypothetical protein
MKRNTLVTLRTRLMLRDHPPILPGLVYQNPAKRSVWSVSREVLSESQMLGDPYVRFDERGVETELRASY